MLDKETVKWLDSLSDKELIAFLSIRFGMNEPQWEKCSKKEYEKHCGKKGQFLLENILKRLLNPNKYKRVPYWNEGGGILDQISGKEPDGYNYYKLKGYKWIILLGSDMMDYVKKRGIDSINN